MTNQIRCFETEIRDIAIAVNGERLDTDLFKVWNSRGALAAVVFLKEKIKNGAPLNTLMSRHELLIICQYLIDDLDKKQ